MPTISTKSKPIDSATYGGIQFNFDTTSSFGVCIPLGDYVFDNTFRRR